MAAVASRVLVVGLGLIGGSVALRLRREGAADLVLGCDPSPEACRGAEARGAVERVVDDAAAAASGADLIVLCAPVSACLALLPDVLRAAPAGGLVTDVCSTKAEVVSAASAALRDRAGPGAGPAFVGGHPLAGSQRCGVLAADPLLFENAAWAVCAPEDTPAWARRRLDALIEALGARPVPMDPALHDRRVAVISHLPQAVAVALAGAAAEAAAADPALLGLAGGGFRDTTRIADSPAEWWQDVFATNAPEVLAALGGFSERLDALRRAIDAGDRSGVRECFAAAHRARAAVPPRRKGLLPGYHDVELDLPDRPGELGSLGAALGAACCNIQDIELLRVREGRRGTLRLGFATAAEAEAGCRALARAGYAAAGPAHAPARAVRAAFQGEAGAYSEEAVRRACGEDAIAVPCRTLADTFGALRRGDADCAVVPVENSRAGGVAGTYELLLEHAPGLAVRGEVVVAVRHCLLGLPGQGIGDVRRVHSHPQALAQCGGFLSRIGAEAVPGYDTAGCARDLAARREPGSAALASARAAELYGLAVLARDVQDDPQNATRFFVVAGGEAPVGGKAVLALRIPDSDAGLGAALAAFGAPGLRVARLDPRPDPQAPWGYRYFAEVRCADAAGLLADLQRAGVEATVLGWTG